MVTQHAEAKHPKNTVEQCFPCIVAMKEADKKAAEKAAKAAKKEAASAAKAKKEKKVMYYVSRCKRQFRMPLTRCGLDNCRTKRKRKKTCHSLTTLLAERSPKRNLQRRNKCNALMEEFGASWKFCTWL